jgi:hypothetical protein
VSKSVAQFDYSSGTVPEAALFVAADEPLLVFPSAAAAKQFLEVTDVKNGTYPAAYGPRGEPYTVRAIQDQVALEPTGERERPDELRTLLLRYLESSGRQAEPNATLDALVAEVWRIESEFWQEHDPFGDRFGTRMPLWGCLAFLLVLGSALYLILR